MGRNCNLELGLVTPSVFSQSSSVNHQEDKQKLTIFYNGRIVACDVMAQQAQAIISLASQELSEGKNKYSLTCEKSPSITSAPPVNYSPTTALYMKKSLQRFLEKRKTRAQETSPYPIIPRHHVGRDYVI